ncbi:Signal recognition particle GTPase [Levilactobacillus paucivorans]|uniref:Signal recognition particle receptor FtsY n=1 Tax=Levilactobacillus paucivorans TaxID=616990 RepID=A0A0R2LE59_9LACO|nr:signal recognition particle-docking protein FtsY [Levilactobacillus paucivorans]KRN98230.1 Signal recognition particle GTPase [Levilactobacillus paucivorans]
MGLFDIFRRRAKQEPASQAPESTAPASSESDVAPASAAPTSEAVSAASSAATETSEASSADSAAPVEASSEAEPVASSVAPETESSTAVTTESAATSSATAEPTSAEPVVESEATEEPEVAITPASEATSESAVAPESEITSESEATSESASTTEPASVATSEAEPAEEAAPESAATAEPATEQPVSDEQLYDKGLEKTRHTFGERLNALLANFRRVDESFFDDLEETLIGADVGFDMAVKISDELRDEVKLRNAKKSADVQNVVVEKLVEIYEAAGNNETTSMNMAPEGPTVILFVGVNGVGKTTTIGKMANRYHQAGKKVLLAAADTFRAGATEQLNVWAQRADVDIVKGKPQSDPAAVVFDAVQKAKREDYDILFVDTAGRLQNKVNLMNELEKMKRIITREIPDAPHEVLLVLDATTGQNALTQAKLFKESTAVTGIVLTKLDGTARGGIVLAIRNELHVPVKFIGLGEQISDLRPFDPNEFVYGLFKGLIDVKALDKKA